MENVEELQSTEVKGTVSRPDLMAVENSIAPIASSGGRGEKMKLVHNCMKSILDRV